MGILLCEKKFRDVWRRNKSVRGEIRKILRTHKHTHTHAAKLVVRISFRLCVALVTSRFTPRMLHAKTCKIPEVPSCIFLLTGVSLNFNIN